MKEEAFDVVHMVDDTISTVLAYMDNEKLDLIVNVQPRIPALFLGDGGLIRRVVKNIVANALKFTHDGYVKLDVSHIRRPYGANLRFVVTDSGDGFTQEELVENLSRVNSYGLGVCKNIVESMGGFLIAKSEKGFGTVVSFSVPLKVLDERSLIQLEHRDKIRAVAYFLDEKYKNESYRQCYRDFINDFGNVMNVRYHAFDDFDRMKSHLAHGTTTHCFIGKSEYLSNKDYFDSISEKLRLVVVIDYLDKEGLEGVQTLRKPFYTLAIANILNEASFDAEDSDFN